MRIMTTFKKPKKGDGGPWPSCGPAAPQRPRRLRQQGPPEQRPASARGDLPPLGEPGPPALPPGQQGPGPRPGAACAGAPWARPRRARLGPQGLPRSPAPLACGPHRPARVAAPPGGRQPTPRLAAPPHKRQPVTSRSPRFAHFYHAWHSCVGPREERPLGSDECRREKTSVSNWSTPFLPTGQTGCGTLAPSHRPARSSPLRSSSVPFSLGRAGSLLAGSRRDTDTARRADDRSRSREAFPALCAVAQRAGQKNAAPGRTVFGAPASAMPGVGWDDGAAPRRHHQR